MKIETVTKGLKIAYVGICGISAGYCTYKMMEKKTDELIDNGGLLNMIGIEIGHGIISTMVGTLAAAFAATYS